MRVYMLSWALLRFLIFLSFYFSLKNLIGRYVLVSTCMVVCNAYTCVQVLPPCVCAMCDSCTYIVLFMYVHF